MLTSSSRAYHDWYFDHRFSTRSAVIIFGVLIVMTDYDLHNLRSGDMPTILYLVQINGD